MLLHMVVIIRSCRDLANEVNVLLVFHDAPEVVRAATTCQVFVEVPHYRVSIWGPIVWKMLSQLTDSSCKINTIKVMNYHEHFHPLKTVVYFQPSLLKKCLIYSTANEKIGELKQIIIITYQ